MMESKNIKKLKRVTIALDEKTHNLLREIKEESEFSQSEVFRKSLLFYHKYKKLIGDGNGEAQNRISTYLEMLSNGEHIILDVDHYLWFLKFIEKSPQREEFWEYHKKISKAHAEEFSHNVNINTVSEVVSRLEACNFFKIIQESPNRFTLLLGSDIPKNFIKIFLEEVLNGMGFKAKIKEDFAKLRIWLTNVVL